MTPQIFEYQDNATFVVVASNGYRAGKEVISQIDVPVVFLQNTGMVQSNFQENYDADAVCYPDPESEFIIANHDRLEGMYIKAELFGSLANQSWYKIITVRVNRDHLLDNEIDNIEMLLKKTNALGGVS